MRVLLWHGWLLERSGSNVYVARVAEALRAAGHDVMVLSQEPHPERLPFVDAYGRVDAEGIHDVRETGAEAAPGRAVVLRPDIGPRLPVFVPDRYEAGQVIRFVDMADEDLADYLDRNVAALRTAVAAHRPEAVSASHAVPGGVIARRALGPGRYVVVVHGSDLEYAIRPQARLAALAEEGFEGALAVVGASEDVVRRAVELVPAGDGRTLVAAPGVDVEQFRPQPDGLNRAAALIEDEALQTGDASIDEEADAAARRRDASWIERIGQGSASAEPEPGAPASLRRLAASGRPAIGFLGRLLAQKGPHHLIAALSLLEASPGVIVVGAGPSRGWLGALVRAVDRGDEGTVRWIEETAGISLGSWRPAPGLASRVGFTGHVDHRFAPLILAGVDALVIPSVLAEAFGLVLAEGAATGALPLAARHSGLGEAAGKLERGVGRPGMFSFAPEPDPSAAIAEGLRRLLAVPDEERRVLIEAMRGFAAEEWSWARTAQEILAAATPG